MIQGTEYRPLWYSSDFGPEQNINWFSLLNKVKGQKPFLGHENYFSPRSHFFSDFFSEFQL